MSATTKTVHTSEAPNFSFIHQNERDNKVWFLYTNGIHKNIYNATFKWWSILTSSWKETFFFYFFIHTLLESILFWLILCRCFPSYRFEQTTYHRRKTFTAWKYFAATVHEDESFTLVVIKALINTQTQTQFWNERGFKVKTHKKIYSLFLPDSVQVNGDTRPPLYPPRFSF